MKPRQLEPTRSPWFWVIKCGDQGAQAAPPVLVTSVPEEVERGDRVLLLAQAAIEVAEVGDSAVQLAGLYEVAATWREGKAGQSAELVAGTNHRDGAANAEAWRLWLEQLAQEAPRRLSAEETENASALFEALAARSLDPIPARRAEKRKPAVWLLTTRATHVLDRPMERLPGNVVLDDRVVLFQLSGRGIEVAGIFQVIGGKRDDRGVYAQLERALRLEPTTEIWNKKVQSELERLSNTPAAKHAEELNLIPRLVDILSYLYPQHEEEIQALLEGAPGGATSDGAVSRTESTGPAEEGRLLMSSALGETRVDIVLEHSPANVDLAVCGSNEAGTPGPLSTAVLRAAGIEEDLLPRRFSPPTTLMVGRNFHVLVVQAMKAGRGLESLQLKRNLEAGLAAAAMDSARGDWPLKHIWIPLLGTGAADLPILTSARCIVTALAGMRWPVPPQSVRLAVPTPHAGDVVRQVISAVAGSGRPGEDDDDRAEDSSDERSVFATDPVELRVVVAVKPEDCIPPPPGAVTDHIVRIKVTARTVEITSGSRERVFSSPNRVTPDQLLANQMAPQRYGQLLYRGVIHNQRSEVGSAHDSTYAGLAAALGALQDRRLQLWCDANDLALHDLWWERLWADGDATPLATQQACAFVRRLNGTARDPIPSPPLKVALAVSNPTTLCDPSYPQLNGLATVDVEQERDILESQTADLRSDGVLSLHHVEPRATLGAIVDAVESGAHILHIIAHGVMLRREFYVVLEDAGGAHDLVTAQRFAAHLASAAGAGLRLVVLATCQSAVRGNESQLPLGPYLITNGVPAVIAMQDVIDYESAQAFSSHFYRQLVRTGRVDAAMAATRQRLFQRDQQRGWDVPVLLLGSDDGTILEPDERSRAVSEAGPQLKSYEQLRGDGDPRPAMLTAAARAVGAAQVIDMPLWNQVRAGAARSSGPAVRAQDRNKLSGLNAVELSAGKLQDHVEASSGLQLPAALYRQTASALSSGKHVIFIGPPGTGKTSLANDICSFVKGAGMTPGAVCATASADWTTFETVGGYVPTEEHVLRFKQGLVLRAVSSGRWLIIDEINRAEIDKAFGELFTMLSGQPVELAYQVDGEAARIVPPVGQDPWVPPGVRPHDVVVHPSWRIIGTMNVYDRSFLFAMSFAFMRRFAFIDVDLPPGAVYGDLIDRWAPSAAGNGAGLPAEVATDVRAMVKELVEADTTMMRRRAIGPAIVRDMLRYVVHRHGDRAATGAEELRETLAETLLLYVVPQLEGLSEDVIVRISNDLSAWIGDGFAPVLKRIADLYPHIPPEAWRLAVD